jgi:hypothetical protein
MRIPEHPTLIVRMRDARIKKVVPRCAPLAASLGRRSGPSEGYHLTLKEEGKTRTVYVPKDLKEEVESSIREHRRIKQLLAEITQLELARIRAHVTHRKRRGNRA